MVWSNLRPEAVLELLVIIFQLVGVKALFLHRLSPRSRWADFGRAALIVSLFGLGVAGALCGRHDSEFALFAGGTLTVLLIGMTCGSGAANQPGLAAPAAGPNLAS